MANTLGIPERTLAQLSDATNSINVIGGTDGRKSAYEPLVVRVTDHVDNVGAEVGTDTNKMAIFMSKAHGQPWVKEAGTVVKVTHKATVINVAGVPTLQVAPANVSTLYPSYDYSTF